MHHIDFYKLIPMPEGNLKVFELGRDMIQANLRDKEVGSISIVESASLKFGSFMWRSER